MKYLITIAVVILSNNLFAQPVIDKIVAQVDDKIILQSEVESYYLQEAQNGEVPENFRCTVLQELITQKIMLIQAAKDSVVVTDDEVEATLDNRIRYFVQMFGSEEAMEEFYGKSIQEIKEEFRDDIYNLLLIQKMQGTVFGDITVSPAEIKEFLNSIPADSLPLISAEVAYSQIVVIPKATAEQKAIAKKKAEELRARIIAGEDFCTLADIYSADKTPCGDLGCNTRETFVTEFSAAAFKLKPGEISEVVETQFGYHIIKCESRQGDKACLKHILIVPAITNTNLTAANKQLDSIRAEIISGKTSWCEAADKYSDDEATSASCGEVLNPQTGESTFEISELSPDDYYTIENLETGEISLVIPYTTADGKKAVRIVRLDEQTKPHQLNLRNDYARLQAYALNQKQTEIVKEWVQERIKHVYIKVDPAYADCDELNALINPPSD